ncbi:hypothetical protein, partial [Aeromonas veronii]|uniref:hypothetical protein n=1 Tax=Aeromonas veronii TaxID=654 RepID=UPI001C53311B
MGKSGALLSVSFVANDNENVFYWFSKKSPSKRWGWSNDRNILQWRHKKITIQVCKPLHNLGTADRLTKLVWFREILLTPYP